MEPTSAIFAKAFAYYTTTITGFDIDIISFITSHSCFFICNSNQMKQYNKTGQLDNFLKVHVLTTSTTMPE